MGWSDEIYARGKCPFCRLLVDMGDTKAFSEEREVEYWSIITLKGHEILSRVAEPLYDVIDRGVRDLEGLPVEAIYLALVRSVKAPKGFGFEYRTLFKEITYVGLLGAEEQIPDRAFRMRHTGDAAEIVNRIRAWLGRCSRHEKCRTRKVGPSSYPDGFRLFDIKSLRVIESGGQEPYIALSYPRAQVEKIEPIRRGESYNVEALPKVLQDMINCVRALDSGISHIWMDQLCVDQYRSDQSRRNIDAMGAIYGLAFATIVLAMPFQGRLEQGLSGLSAPRELYQRQEIVGKLRLATTYPSLDMAIVTSKWNTRGWTLEEGIISRRCIIFGPEQVYFECAEMANYESIQEPSLASPEHDHLIPYKSRLQNPFLCPYDYHKLYWHLVGEYTSRDLTHEKDALNAFSAFTAEFERDGHSLLWGLPTVGMAHNLLWEHDLSEIRNIRRREGFPSWSWAGWCGKAAMYFPLDDISKASHLCFVTQEPPRSRVLKCRARTARVSIEGQAPIYSVFGAPLSSISIDCGINQGWSSMPRECTLMEICEIDGAVWGLLMEQRDECFERIGMGWANCSDSEVVRFEPRELRLA